MKEFAEWSNFYVIVGSSAGALIGLQFVVLTLIANHRIPASREANRTFATPTIVHLCTALLLAALLSAPWHGATVAAVLWGTIGFIGIIYAAVICWRLRAQSGYEPVFEDWLFHGLLPLGAYIALISSAIAATAHMYECLFAVAAAVLMLLFAGIHNAWDSVTYLLFEKYSKNEEDEAKDEGEDN